MDIARVFLCLLALAHLTPSHAQDARILEPRVFGGYSVGFNCARIEVDSGPRFSALPWFSGSLDLGGSLTWQDRWGLAVQGSGSYNGSLFYGDTLKHSHYHLVWGTEARVWWQGPYRHARDRWLRAGCAFGWSIFGNGYLDRVEGSFEAHSIAVRHTTPYLAPEIGFMVDEGLDRFEVGIRYLWHVDRTPAFTTLLTVPGGMARGTGTHDQLAIVMRYYLGFERRERTPPPYRAVDFAQRDTDTLTTLHARRAIVTLDLWDDAEFDGDTVSVLLNEEPVVTGLALTHRRQKVRLQLQRGTNRVMVVAHNEGRVPPNTASCRVRGVPGAPELLLKTSLSANQLVTIMRDR